MLALILLFLVLPLVVGSLLGWMEFNVCRAAAESVIPWGLFLPLAGVLLCGYWAGAFFFRLWPFFLVEEGWFYDMELLFYGSPVLLSSLGAWIGGIVWLIKRKKYPAEEE